MEFMLDKIKTFFKRYWLEILVFGGVFSILVWACAGNLTWLMCDSDGTEYVMDSLYFYPAHHTSAPLYLLMGHVFLWIPFGELYWRMSFMSACFTLGSMIFIYLIIRHYIIENRGRYWGLIAAVIFGGSALAFSQAIIVQTFAVVTFFSIAAFYFVLKKRWAWASAMIGMGVVTHHLMLLTWLALFIFNRELRVHIQWNFAKFPYVKISNYWHFLITCSFALCYLYVPLSIMFTDQPNMWGNTSVGGFFTVNWAVFSMLVGKISIWDLPKRIFDTFGVLGISLGFALIPIVWWAWNKKFWKNQLFWLFSLPIIYQIGNMCPQTMKYMEASIAWGAIIACVWLAQKNIKWLNILMVISAVAILFTSAYKLNIKNLDPELSATKFYQEEIPKIPDYGIFISQDAWVWEEIYLYNKQHDTHIVAISVPTLPAEIYRNMLLEQGVNVIDTMPDVYVGESNSHELNEKQISIAIYIIEHNDNVFTSRSTDPSTYGAKVVPAKENKDIILQWLGEKEVNPEVQWKPSNPYSSLSGDIEVEQWRFIVQSNKHAMWLLTLAIGGYMCVIFSWKAIESFRKKKKDKTHE